MASIRIENLYKSFDDGAVVAVDDLSLEINDGEFIVIVGPSGCGKSTTLNCLAGLENPTSGRIYLADQDVTDDRPQRRDMAMVFQNYALYPHMNVRENLSFGLRMRTNMSKREIHERVDEVAELLEISELLAQRPKNLSGGQQQRVALGRAIARDPEVFLMDEPLSNLDAKLRTQMRAELQNLQERLGVTTVYVTHDQTEAMTMGDRIAILNGGKLQQIGTPLECYHEPANQFVAGFIGSPSMNFVNVSFDGRNFRHEEFSYAPSDEFLSRIDTDADQLVLGIRPEDVRIREEPGQNVVEATIDVVEPMGDETNLLVSYGDVTNTVTGEGEVRYERGVSVYLEYPEQYLHVFDARTGDTVVNRAAPYATEGPAVPV